MFKHDACCVPATDLFIQLASQHLGGFPLQMFGCNTSQTVQIKFNALGALTSWCQADLPPVVVHNSDAWKASRREMIATSNAVQQSYDWCEPHHHVS
jgi:hypothetical protein